MTPGLDVLSISRGHLSFNFDKADPTEVEKARRVIQDMLGRGYALFVEVNGELRKVQRFDPATDHYILSDVPESTAQPKGKRGRPKGVPMTKSRATGVGPTSGG